MPNLLLFMTPGIGLKTWEKIGILNRELKPYVEYVRRGWLVRILTFDKGKIPELPDGITAVHFPHYRLLWLLPWIHYWLGKWADIIKTNQSHNVHYYTRAAKYWRKPILLRCGYVHGEYLETTGGLTGKTKKYHKKEKRAFREATHCQVPTKELAEWVKNRYGISEEKISVVPNFVDTDVFRPLPGIERKEKSVISIGRLHPVKQFDLLIKACAQISGCTLTIIGEGPERSKLEQLAREFKVNLNLPGNIPNEKLPEILNQNMVFAITSGREGHPKALIEAMACGLPCVGVESIGVKDIIISGENGLVVDIYGISQCINEILEDKNLAYYFRNNARKFVEQQFGFNRCFLLEYKLLFSLKFKMECINNAKSV